MLLGHFERFTPVCPACRAAAEAYALAINVVEIESAGDIEAGILGCPNCGAEFPIIDGMPIIVPDVRRYIQDSSFYLLTRDNLTPAVESLFGDAAGPNTAMDSVRQHLSSYAWDHWASHDPQENPQAGDPEAGAIARTVAQALDMRPRDSLDGGVLDIGCGGGRSIVELALQTGRKVLGIDISVPLARLSRRAAVERHVSYPRRRVGLVYDRRTFDLALDLPRDAADVWICDVLALPFQSQSFSLVTAFNVIDCTSDPRIAVSEIERVLQVGGTALLSTPFDWSGNVTPLTSWLGGHSQRGAHNGSAEAILDMLLGDGPRGVGALRKVSAIARLPWHVRLHDRAFMHYQAYVVAARRNSATKPAE